mgnify:CR=1 FL=1
MVSIEEIQSFIAQLLKRRGGLKVRDILEAASEKYSLDEEQLLGVIKDMAGRGEINLYSSEVHGAKTDPAEGEGKNVYRYLAAEGKVNFTVVILAAASVLAVLAIPEAYPALAVLRWILGGIFLLFLPGYSLLRALYPEREFDVLERIALSVFLSVALTSILGLILNFTPAGVSLLPVLVAVAAFTVICSLIDFLRRIRSLYKSSA